MKIMAVNAGSSSLKFQLLEMPSENVISSGLVERIGMEEGVFTLKFSGNKKVVNCEIKDHKKAVLLVVDALIKNSIIKSLDEIKGVGHRIVQGGEIFENNCLVNDKVIEDILSLSDLAPLHNPAHVVGIKAFQHILENVPAVVVFDTTFHRTMDELSYMYATPYEWYEKYGIRKYGAHGTSHQYVSQRVNALLGRKDTKVIVCHLGNGASICAVKNGISIDTSMGLTPLEGIPMGTRSGNIDPTVLQVIHKKENKSIDELMNILNKKSGFLGVSGVSSDSRDIEESMLSGNKRSKLAFDLQIKRICDYIGSYYILMGGVDAIAFTAGIGENSSDVRKAVVDRLFVLGTKLDEAKNALRGENEISTKDSKVKIFVIPTNEEVMIAREVVRLAKL